MGNCSSSFAALCSVGSVILHVFIKFQGTPDFIFLCVAWFVNGKQFEMMFNLTSMLMLELLRDRKSVV